MNKPIDHISINDGFWVQFKSHLISFGIEGLPEGTHFTISFHPRSTDINFHVTKNGTDPKDKPQVKIVVIDRIVWEREATSACLAVFKRMLLPLSIDELKAKNNGDLDYIPFDCLQNEEVYSLMKQQLFDSFKGNSRVKKQSRLKIRGDIGECIEKFASSESLQQTLLDNTAELPVGSRKYFESGLIMAKDYSLQVIRINEEWFLIRPDVKPLDFLCAFIDPQLVKHLIFKTKRALIAVKHAEKYSDTKHLNKPIRLDIQNRL